MLVVEILIFGDAVLRRGTFESKCHIIQRVKKIWRLTVTGIIKICLFMTPSTAKRRADDKMLARLFLESLMFSISRQLEQL